MANPNGNPQNLRNGGTNKGGPGRPPKEVRDRCAEKFWERIDTLCEIADDKTFGADSRLSAIDKLGKYGGLTSVDVTSGDEPISQADALAQLTAIFAAKGTAEVQTD